MAQTATVVTASAIGVVADVKIATSNACSYDGVNTLTLGSGDPAFTAADVGKIGIMIAMSADLKITPPTRYANFTITSFISATQVKITPASIVGAKSVLRVLWFTDNAPTVNGAAVLGNAVGPVELNHDTPGGLYGYKAIPTQTSGGHAISTVGSGVCLVGW